MSPNFFVDPVSGGGAIERVFGNQHRRGPQVYSSGSSTQVYEGHEVYHKQSGLDKATQNYYIAGIATMALGQLFGKDNPELRRTTEIVGSTLVGVGAIREYTNPREEYHREQHVYGQNQNSWEMSNNGHWQNDSSYRLNNGYEIIQGGGRRHGHHGGQRYESETYSHEDSSSSGYYNNGWNSGGWNEQSHSTQYRRESGHTHGHRGHHVDRNMNYDPNWQPWVLY